MKRNIPEGPIRETSDKEPMGYSAPSRSPNEGSEPFNTDSTEDIEDGDAIMVGVVGSAAPWFLTGWTNDVEVEFMIDTGCQVTILATIGTAYPTETGKPVAMADVAESSGPAGTGGPVVAGTRFLAVADVYAPFGETEGGPPGDIGRVDQISKIP